MARFIRSTGLWAAVTSSLRELPQTNILTLLFVPAFLGIRPDGRSICLPRGVPWLLLRHTLKLMAPIISNPRPPFNLTTSIFAFQNHTRLPITRRSLRTTIQENHHRKYKKGSPGNPPLLSFPTRYLRGNSLLYRASSPPRRPSNWYWAYYPNDKKHD